MLSSANCIPLVHQIIVFTKTYYIYLISHEGGARIPMKKEAKIVSFILAIILIFSALAGCGRSKNDHSAYRQKRLEWESHNPYNHICYGSQLPQG